MGVFRNLLGTMLDTFGIGPKGARATLDASALSADRALALPDRAGMLALYGDPIALAVSQAGHGFVVGNAVCKSGANWLTADRDSATRTAIGLVSEVVDGNTFVVTFAGVLTLATAEWDAVAGTSGGLTPGEFYCLSSTPGQITAAKPADGILQWLMCADSATTAIVQLGEPFDRGTGEALAATWTSIVKESDEARTSTTTHANDSALQFQCEAGKRYFVRGFIFYSNAGAGGLKHHPEFSGTESASYSHLRQTDPGEGYSNGNEFSGAQPGFWSANTATGIGSGMVQFHAVFTADDAGTFAYQWAQQVSNASATTVRAGSYLEYAVVGEQAGNTMAAAIGYDNNTSGLLAEDVQAAVDELAASGGEGFDPSEVYFLHEEFRTTSWYSGGQVNGSGAAITLAGPVAGRPGIVTLNTGTTSGGFAFETDVNSNWLFFGQGEIEMWWDFTTPAALSDATNSYFILIGTRDIGAAGRTESLALAYSDSVNGGKWAIESITGGVTSYVNGTTGPAADTRYRMRLVVNAAGTSAELFLRPFGGAEFSVGTTTTIPAGGQRRTHGIFKLAGTSARSMHVDYATLWARFAPER